MVSVKSNAGYRDWLVQRITAVIIAAYAIFLMLYVLINQPIGYAQWQVLFGHAVMRIATFVVLLSILWHAWIGLWTIFTDYVKPKNIRLLLEIIVCVLLIVYLIWCFEILWG